MAKAYFNRTKGIPICHMQNFNAEELSAKMDINSLIVIIFGI